MVSKKKGTRKKVQVKKGLKLKKTKNNVKKPVRKKVLAPKSKKNVSKTPRKSPKKAVANKTTIKKTEKKSKTPSENNTKAVKAKAKLPKKVVVKKVVSVKKTKIIKEKKIQNNSAPITASKIEKISKIQKTKKAITKKEKIIDTIKERVEKAKFENILPDQKQNKNEIHVHHIHDPYLTPIEPPNTYLKDRIVLLVVDPKHVFTYWELNPETVEYAKGMIGHHSWFVLRIYDVTNLECFNGFNAHCFWDIDVKDRIGNWYVKLNDPDKSLVIDIGLKNSNGDFYTLCRSNYDFAPRVTMSSSNRIYWMSVNEKGEAVITDVEELTDEDIELLRRMLGDRLYRLFRKGNMEEFLGSSEVRQKMFEITDFLGGAS